MDIWMRKGTILHRRYRIIQLLGQGDFGAVYKARDLSPAGTNRLVAIKEMPMQLIVECERQADLRARLIHPAIPRIHDYFMTDEHSYLVQQLIRGSNLEVILNTHPGFLSEKRVIRWAIQLCDVLHFLHNHPAHPVIFRDLKPNNVMADSKDRIYLADFELVRVFPPGFFTERGAGVKYMGKSAPVGTEGYSPPEQYRGFVRPESDLYALGATMHHLLTRRDPRKEKAFTFQNFPVRSLNPDVSRELEEVVMKALQRDVRKRYGSAGEMLAALSDLTM
jgi:serine/threonine protein kinase